MAYGMAVTSPSGRVLIDGETPLYTEVASGTALINTPVENLGTLRRGALPTFPQYSNSVIALEIPIGVWVSFSAGPGPSVGSWQTEYTPAYPENTVFTSEDAYVLYTVFAPTSQVPPSADTHGLRIYNSAGALVFDSGHRTFNVVQNPVIQFAQNNRNESYLLTAQPGSLVIPTVGGIRGYYYQSSVASFWLTGFIRRNVDGTYSKKIDGYEYTYSLNSSYGTTIWQSVGNIVEIRVT